VAGGDEGGAGVERQLRRQQLLVVETRMARDDDDVGRARRLTVHKRRSGLGHHLLQRRGADDEGAATPARRFGLERKGAIEVGRDADLVLFDPAARRTIRAADLHHTSDYTPYEGLEVAGAVRSVFVRGRVVIRDGVAVGDRGFGRFVERGAISGEPAKG
jgi:N-acyl-D-aspartate/D-glutamate deacylase